MGRCSMCQRTAPMSCPLVRIFSPKPGKDCSFDVSDAPPLNQRWGIPHLTGALLTCMDTLLQEHPTHGP